MLRQQRKKADGIKKIGFADAVGAGNAVEGAEVNRKIEEIFKAVHFQSSKHKG
jgi:hypothetical protein